VRWEDVDIDTTSEVVLARLKMENNCRAALAA